MYVLDYEEELWQHTPLSESNTIDTACDLTLPTRTQTSIGMITAVCHLSMSFQNASPWHDTRESAKNLECSRLWAFDVGFHCKLQPSHLSAFWQLRRLQLQRWYFPLVNAPPVCLMMSERQGSEGFWNILSICQGNTSHCWLRQHFRLWWISTVVILPRRR